MDYRLWSLVMRWMPKWLLAMECNSLHSVFSTFFIFVLHLLKYTTFQTQLQNIKKKTKTTIKIRHPGSVPNPSSNFSKLTWETHPYTYDNVETLIALFKIRNQKNIVPSGACQAYFMHFLAWMSWEQVLEDKPRAEGSAKCWRGMSWTLEWQTEGINERAVTLQTLCLEEGRETLFGLIMRCPSQKYCIYCFHQQLPLRTKRARHKIGFISAYSLTWAWLKSAPN